MQLQIITIYCLCADFLNEYGFQDHCRSTMTTAEVMTTALTASFLFNNHLDKGREFLLHDKAMPNRLSKSRFKRRLHNISDLLWKAFFEWASKRNLSKNEATEFIVDSFPIEVCHFVCANRSKIYT